MEVIGSIGPEVHSIYVVDDKCPEESGKYVAENCTDERVKVIFNEINLGVGGAVKNGYKWALNDSMDIIIKIDGDGQMDTSKINILIQPIINGSADYTKGNRFFNLDDLKSMPFIRILGNAGLSFFTKLSSGYWNLFDPTNGYTAIHRTTLQFLPLDKIANRYFFESDMLFRLNTIRAVAVDIPMPARYADEVSNLSVVKSIPQFFFSNCKNFVKRIVYNYFLRNFSIASLELIFGSIFTMIGMVTGINNWLNAVHSNIPAATGLVVLPALFLILGFQMILAFLNYDIENIPDTPLQKKL